MKVVSVKRPVLTVAAALLCLLSGARPDAAPAAQEEELQREGVWTRVRSKNFQLVGNADERDIRRVASRLEQFREVFTRLLPDESFDSFVPVTVVVFDSEAAYRPFKPLYQGQPAEIAGYFKGGQDTDYITLSIEEQKGRRNSSSLAFHEYVHLLVRNSSTGAPLWFNEGLAEYYSTFEISADGRRVTLGRRLDARVETLRGAEWLPLSTLFEVDRLSPYYLEADKRQLFYAESWALVHYLLNGQDGARREQAARYLSLLASGKTIEEAFRTAFRTDFASLEGELRAYVRRAKYPTQVRLFAQPVAFDSETQSAPMTRAESLALLGDLLLHTDQQEAAEDYLRRSIALAPDSDAAHTSLGILRLRQSRYAEAREQLTHALLANPENYLAHYSYAQALAQEGSERDATVEGFERKTAQLRAELKRAIELAPRFLESYRLLAQIELERSIQMDEALATLHRALALAPRREDFKLQLAQVHLRKDELAEARRVVEEALKGAADSRLRTTAEAILRTVAAREELLARLKHDSELAAPDALPAKPVQPCDMPEPGPQMKRLRFEGEQVCGLLREVECDEGRVVLSVAVGERTLKLQSPTLNRIRFVTYTTEVRGHLTCGLREPANPVLVTFRLPKNDPAKTDGEVIAVEFVPRDWGH